MSIKNLQEKGDDQELYNSADNQISRMLVSLDKAVAPKDFDFKLKARIASARENYKTPPNNWLKYLLPSAASAILLAFVFYGTFFNSSAPTEEQAAVNASVQTQTTETPQVANPENSFIAEAETIGEKGTESNSPANKIAISPSNSRSEKILASQNPKSDRKEPAKSQAEDIGSGSYESSLTTAGSKVPKVFEQRNITAQRPSDLQPSNKISMAEMLNINGIATVIEGGKRKISSVVSNSIAHRSGLKAGDIILSFDTQKSGVGTNPEVGESRKLVVLRGDKTLTFVLK